VGCKNYLGLLKLTKQEILSDAWHLKQRISGDWNKIDQQLIDSAVKQWHKRLAACVSAQGGHLEHMLKSRTPN